MVGFEGLYIRDMNLINYLYAFYEFTLTHQSTLRGDTFVYVLFINEWIINILRRILAFYMEYCNDTFRNTDYLTHTLNELLSYSYTSYLTPLILQLYKRCLNIYMLHVLNQCKTKRKSYYWYKYRYSKALVEQYSWFEIMHTKSLHIYMMFIEDRFNKISKKEPCYITPPRNKKQKTITRNNMKRNHFFFRTHCSMYY